MHVIGITTDIPVSDLAAARHFYVLVLGRAPDLTPNARTLEWVLHRDPDIAVRLTVPVDAAAVAGPVRLGLGVADLDAESARLRASMAELPPVRVRPGVIALLELTDPDGNLVVLWQDLLVKADTDTAG